jgi:PAS domain S-box-containing protein
MPLATTQALMALQGVQTALLVLLLLLFYFRMRREAFLLWWSFAWMAHGASLAAALASLSLGPQVSVAKELLTLSSFVAALLHACLLALGGWTLPRSRDFAAEPGKWRPLLWWPWVAAAVILAALVYAASKAADSSFLAYLTRAIVRLAAQAAAYLYCAFAFHQWWRESRSQGARLTAYACALYGLYGLAWALLMLQSQRQPSGPLAWFADVVDAACLAAIALGMVLLLLDEHRRSERARIESEARFGGVAESLAEGVIITSPEDKVLYANAAFLRMTGFSRSQVIGQAAYRLLHAPSQWEFLWQKNRERLAGRSDRYEIPMRRKDGASFPAEVSAAPYRDAAGQVLGVLNVISDISDRKRATSLQNALYQIADAAQHPGSLDHLFAAVHKIIHTVMPANNFYIALYDERDDLVSFPYFVDELDQPERPRKPRKGNTEYVLRTGRSLLSTVEVHKGLELRGEVELIGPMSPIWLGVPLKIGDKTIGVMVVQHYQDAHAYGSTEQRMLEFVSTQVAKAIEFKRAQEALRQSEAKFAKVFRSSPDAVMISTLDDGRYLDINEGFERLTGFSRAEVLGRTSVELGFWTDPGQRQEFVQRLRRDGRIVDYVGTFRKKSGERYTSMLSAEMVELGGQMCILTTERDITERRRMEEALRASEEKFARAFRSSPDAMVISRLQDGIFIEVNEGFLQLTGYAREEVIGQSSLKLNMWSSVETREQIVRQLRERGSVRNIEAEFLDKGGQMHIGLLSAELMNFGGEPCMLAVTRDITQRKRMEEAVRMSEEKFSKAFHASPDAMVISSMSESRFLEVNESFLRLTAYAREEVVGRTSNDLRLWADPDHRVRVSHAVREKGGLRNEEFQLRTRSGEVLICLLSVDMVELGGQPCFLNVIRDITDRKQMEEALRYSEERYRELFENANDIVYTHDLAGNFTSLNRTGERLTGYTAEEALRLNISAILSPEQHDFARRMVQQKLEGKGPTTYELEIRSKDGKPLTIEVSTRLIFHEGTPIGVQGIARDITERKRTESERLRYLRVQTALGQASRALLSSTLDPEELLDQVLAVAFRSVPAATKGAFLRWDEQKGALTVRRTAGYKDPRVNKLTLIKEGYSYQAAATRQAQLVVDTHASPEFRYDGEIEESRAIRSGVAAPLISKDRVLGVVSLDSEQPGAFDEDDKELLMALAGHAALALENAMLYEQVEESRENYRIVSDLVSDWAYSIRVTPDGHFVNEWITEAFARSTGYTPEELEARGGWLALVHPEDRHLQQQRYQRLLAGHPEVTELRILDKHGEVRWIRDYGRPEQDPASGRVVRFYGAAQDVTERHALEEQLRQAQKMEAVGRLAGGVAHDFNNLLMVIRGYTELLTEQLPPDSPLHRSAMQIEKAADRAAGLTQQLLAFSRKQMLAPQVLNLNTSLAGVDRMLHRLIGEHIEIVTCPGDGLGWVKADPGQIEQVILNLALNARDAMPNGGKLTLETANAVMDEQFVRVNRGAVPGEYVLLAVSDTGAGMDAATQARIFEPFFTTKEVGKGTGLGLATVYGIVKQSNGYITVESEPGQGACFRIYLPRVPAPADAAAEPQRAPAVAHGRETVLVVEDQDDVRDLALEFLRSQGYVVLHASNGADALQVAGRHSGKIDCMITDVIMPGMSGPELAQRLTAERPDMRVLFVSGYAEDAIGQHGVLEKGTQFLSKPFSREALSRKLREILENGGSSAAR